MTTLTQRMNVVEENLQSIRLTLDTLLQNLLNPALMVPGTLRFGGNQMELGNNGIQVLATGSNRPAIIWTTHFLNNVDPDTQDLVWVKGYLDKASDGEIEIGIAMNETDSTAAAFIDFTAGGIGASTPYGAVRSRGRIQLDAADSSDTSANKSLTGNTNDLAIGRSSVIVRLSADGAYNLTGMANGAQNRWVILWNSSANTITLKNEDAASTAANRYALKADIALAQYAGATFVYDSDASRWRCVGLY